MAKAKTNTEKLALLRRGLDNNVTDYAAVLPPDIPPDKLVRSVVLAAKANPLLLSCTRDSLFEAAMRAAMLGLEIGAGGCWFVPYKNSDTGQYVAQIQTDYRGEIKLALQHPDLASIQATNVYEGEDCRIKSGTVNSIEHEQRIDIERTDEKITATYAVAYFNNAAPPQFVLLSREQVEKTRQSSRGKDAMMWAKWWGEGARKTAIRRLCKTLPKSTKLQWAHLAESLAEQGVQGNVPGLDDWKPTVTAEEPDDA